ncbi:MAG: peptidoglycan bridge formation glycyltransferase FemA/FemB family protein [Candidatus Beckwithbacteria bacterium]
MSDLRQAKEYELWMKSLGWLVDEGAFIKKLLGISFIKIQRQKKIDDLDLLVKKYRAVLVKIEPAIDDNFNYGRWGFKEDKTPMLPTKTIWLDLTKSENQLLKEMHYKTRYNLRKYSGKVKMIRGDKVSDKQLKDFFKIYRQNCKKQKFWGLNFKQLKSLLKSFGGKAWLLMAEGGGLIVLIHNQVAYYSHNASSQEGRKKMVPSRLAWKAIRLAKKLKCRLFDFDGIDDKLWPGFTRFKKSFGGREVEYRQPVKKLFIKEWVWPK